MGESKWIGARRVAGAPLRRMMDGFADVVLGDRGKPKPPAAAAVGVDASGASADQSTVTVRALREEIAHELAAQVAQQTFSRVTTVSTRKLVLERIAALEAGRCIPDLGFGLVALRAILDEFSRRSWLIARSACVHCGGLCWPMTFSAQLTLRQKHYLVRTLQEIDDLGRLYAMNPDGVPDREFWDAPWPVHVLRRDDVASLAGKDGAWTGAVVRLAPEALRLYCGQARHIVDCF